jgi:hypothetical protein
MLLVYSRELGYGNPGPFANSETLTLKVKENPHHGVLCWLAGGSKGQGWLDRFRSH